MVLLLFCHSLVTPGWFCCRRWLQRAVLWIPRLRARPRNPSARRVRGVSGRLRHHRASRSRRGQPDALSGRWYKWRSRGHPWRREPHRRGVRPDHGQAQRRRGQLEGARRLLRWDALRSRATRARYPRRRYRLRLQLLGVAGCGSDGRQGQGDGDQRLAGASSPEVHQGMGRRHVRHHCLHVLPSTSRRLSCLLVAFLSAHACPACSFSRLVKDKASDLLAAD